MSSEPRTSRARGSGRGRGASQSRGAGHGDGPATHRHSTASHGFDLPVLPEAVDIFDTTLRDGSQQEGLSLTVDDKLRVAEQLDHLGVAFIEGGWPGANHKDEEFFARAPAELRLSTATLVAFGSTRRAGVRAEDDEVLRQLVKANTEAVCIVAKASKLHVTEALRTTLDEAVAMAADSVGFLRDHDLRVFFDAEHFFDGYRDDREFTLRVLRAAEEAGAEAIVLCDTNGGTLPHDAERIVAGVVADFECQVGVHFHNDSGCAVANSIAGVRAGATHVQGCVNGYGERTGNADLSAAIPNLSLKLNVRTIPPDRLERITPVSHHIAELVNIAPNPQQPYVGSAAFAHKAGLHTSAIARRRDAYEHVPPDAVGNGTRFVVSEMAGRSTLALKAQELGLELDSDALTGVLDTLKTLEYRGYHFEVADGSLELLLRKATGWEPGYFEVESFRVINDHTDNSGDPGRHTTEATVRIRVGDTRVVATAEGNGPVNALDSALRQAIGAHFPNLDAVHLVDYRVRVLDTGKGTGAVTRVLIDTSDGERVWTTIGVSENIIEASWQALYDSIVYGLLHADRGEGDHSAG
ncbi:MAG TPA: citramalate synthase [Acidimicrobiales bacterium]|nr:citramalate synthase [Acidimicrobiales bacterium]HLN41941.1 citramalate synthase [Acidimicrobiales bacterium]